MQDGTLLPVTRLRATGAGGGAAVSGHVGMDFSERAPMDTRRGRMVWFGSKNPHPFNRRFIYLARGANVKMPWLLAFAQHVEDSPYWAQKPRGPTFMEPDIA